jgi:hypothetical protein
MGGAIEVFNLAGIPPFNQDEEGILRPRSGIEGRRA